MRFTCSFAPFPLYFVPGARHNRSVQSLVRWIACLLLSGLAAHPAQAAFSSLYAFGDGVCTTTDNVSGPASLYYGNRYCNGRIWIEVLAQRQGLAYDPAKNWSYFGHYSSNLVEHVSQFSPPADANTSLFVVWVNDADFVDDMSKIYPSLDAAVWSNAMTSSLANHLQVLTNLYAKGARTLVMPNAADITKTPQYSGLPAADKSFIRQRVIDFNAGFAAMLDQARASLPGAQIYVPDIFALLDQLAAHPADYGLVNPGIDAVEDPNLTDYSLNGPGADYLFWDAFDPTAKAHAVIAGVMQQMISPASISALTLLNGSNQLAVANLPIGLNGSVDGTSNLASGTWTPVTDFDSTNATQTISVQATGPWQFYRLRFPFAWSWP
jgi:phospholipase/lecithinase/hemolysin